MWLLLIPPAALLLALLWTALRGRPKRAREAMITIEGYRRSMDALARPVDPSAGSAPKDAVYPGDAVRGAKAAAPAREAMAGRPARPPRVEAVVPAARVVDDQVPGDRASGDRMPEDRASEDRAPKDSADAELARRRAVPEATGPLGSEPAR
ncbi:MULTISPECIES: hypothetical protein [Pseudofrankia]|uniref:hypothetical protein n=1 Tax=Pseudofrankia TaxID=2994363 RepID=UPI000234D12B|nr:MULTISPECIES: hypothetical protein [Pseudofrankia]OHV37430.1 hypothetical protein BCD49_15885 [Pseudofrankia sp. EUN1h]